MKNHILVVDDALDSRKLLDISLTRDGYRVSTASSGNESLNFLQENIPDLIVLDVQMPDMTGFEVCQRVRSNTKTSNIPIVMLTAQNTSQDEIQGLEIGADDYVVKPFDYKVLLARIKKTLQKNTSGESIASDVLDAGELKMDAKKNKVWVNAKEISFTALEFRILFYLMSHPGQVFNRKQIIQNAWTDDVTIQDRAVAVHLNTVRTKLGSASHLIETVRGVGYRFKEK